MQFVLAGVGWDYLPHVTAVVGIAAVWWWSQGAPESGPTITTYGLAAPPGSNAATPVSVGWKGVRWQYANHQVVPFCATEGHESYRLLFSDGDRVTPDFRARLRGDRRRLVCAAEEGHTVPLDGVEWPSSDQYESAQQEARSKLIAER